MSEDQQQPAVEREPAWIRFLEHPLVALVVACLLFLAASWLAYFFLGYQPPMSPDMRAVSEALLNIAFLWVAYTLAIRHLGDKPRDDLPLDGAVKWTAQGVAIGAALFAAVVAVAALLGAYRIVGEGNLSGLIVGIFSFALLPGFREELLFRGILFRWLEEFGGSWFALAVTSLLFGLAHIFNPNATWYSSFAIAVEAGVLLGAAYMLTRNLWVPIGLHAAWNFTQYAFDVPVSGIDSNGLVEARLQGPEWLSGGPFGLEASVIALVFATALGIWMLVQAKRRGLVYGPMWRRDGAITFPDQAERAQPALAGSSEASTRDAQSR